MPMSAEVITRWDNVLAAKCTDDIVFADRNEVPFALPLDDYLAQSNDTEDIAVDDENDDDDDDNNNNEDNNNPDNDNDNNEDDDNNDDVGDELLDKGVIDDVDAGQQDLRGVDAHNTAAELQGVDGNGLPPELQGVDENGLPPEGKGYCFATQRTLTTTMSVPMPHT